MASVVPLRRFKVPGLVETQFFTQDDSKNKSFMQEDLARSGLTPEDVESYTAAGMRLEEGALAGYGLPYYDLNGNPLVDSQLNLIFYRIRMKYPDFSRASRYTQPHGEQSAKYGLPSFLPYIPPKTLANGGDVLVCCEGEKKTAAVVKHLGYRAFGIGGAQMWRDPSGSGGVHPWIRKLADKLGVKKILIVPDGDVFRYDICAAYGTYANALQQAGYEVEILNPRGKIDDLIKEWGDDSIGKFESLERIDPLELVQSSSSLIQRYSLAFSENAKGQRTVAQHSSNVTKLMQEHPAFPKIWRNLDTNRVMVGDQEAVPDHTEMRIANYFQHHLSMPKVNRNDVLKVVQYLARENERSPFLEWVRSLEWDGQERLSTWISQRWGVPDTPFLREVSRKWLISACARLDKPGTKIDWILIIVGRQGTGKTSMPGILFRGNYTPIYGEQNDKDLHLLLHSSLCTGFDELDSFGKRETSNLKAMITRSEDAFRPPYGATIEVFPRRFTLYGCGNRHEFLQHDPSGYRRYAIVEVDRLLDFAGLEGDCPQLWAEAWDCYRRGGERYWEVEGASENAKGFVIPNVEEEKIVGWISKQFYSKVGKETNVKDDTLYFTMAGLISSLQMDGKASNPHFTRDIAAILVGLGCEKGNTRAEVVPGVSGRHYKLKKEAFDSATVVQR